MQEDINHIVASDLLDYSFKVEQAIKEGWTFSDKSEYCPRAWPHMFEAFMVKSLAEIKQDFINQQEVANTATNVAENSTVVTVKDTPKQSTRRNAKK